MIFKNIKQTAQSVLHSMLFASAVVHARTAQVKKLQHKLKTQLANKTILITGASYGIGEQLAYLLASPNIQLVLIARTEDKLQQVQNKVTELGGRAYIFALDMRDEHQLNDFIHQLKQQQIDIDILVSNAGKSIKRPVMASLDRLHDYQRTMAINYFAPVQLALALIPTLAQNHGHLINISAVNVLYPPMPEWSAYQASKSAFDQWFRSATPELRAQNITTSTLYLPLVRTRMSAPTKMYENAPAMTAKQVAVLIGWMMVSGKKSFRPWWSYPVAWFAHLCQRPIYAVLKWYYRRHKT